MKLNTQTTALGLLSPNPNNRIFLPEELNDRAIVDFYKNEFKSMRPLLSQRIQYISWPFYKAFEKSKGKILKMLMHEPIKQSGTFILPYSDDLTLTIFYDLETKCKKSEFTVNGRLLLFSKEKIIFPLPSLIFYIHKTDNYTRTLQLKKDITEEYTTIASLNTFLGLILFTQYCEVETKLVPAGKETNHRLQRYVNHTKLPIEILDATWFTTLVRSGAFTVGNDTGGFFRWQAVGPGRSERKLIWVNPYQKQGYTRKAKVLMHRPEPPTRCL